MWPADEPATAQRLVPLADGRRVRVVEVGDAPGAPTILFVHGWCCSAFTWRHALPAAAAAGYRAVAVDLRGHGASDKPLEPELYTLPALGRHLLDILDALGLERALVVGHSMGGAVAVRAALDEPERIAGLVLVSPVAFGAVPLMKLVHWLTPSVVEPALARGSRSAVARLAVRVTLRLASGRWRRPDPRVVDEYWAPARSPEFVRAMVRVAHAFDWSPGRPEELERVRCPTTVLFGTRDVLVRGGRAERYVRCIPGARLLTVRGGGHVLPEEEPELVAAAVSALAGTALRGADAPVAASRTMG